MRRLRILLPLLLLVLLGAVTAYWWIASDRLGAGIARWRDDARAQGLVADYADPAFGGWPLRLTATFQAPLLGLPSGEQWQGPPEVLGYAWLWDPQTLHFEAPGQHQFLLPQGKLLLDAAGAEATAGFSGGLLDVLSLSLKQAVLSNAATSQSLSADSLDFTATSLTPRERDDYAVDFALDLRGAPLPPAAKTAIKLLGPRLDTLVLGGKLSGTLAGRDARAMAAAWRDSGGDLDLDRIELAWGELSLKGSGTLALDEAFRPLGAFSLETHGLIELIQRMGDAGMIDGDRKLALTVALSALSTGRDEAGRSIVKLPLTMQDGTLYLGMVPLGALRPLF